MKIKQRPPDRRTLYERTEYPESLSQKLEELAKQEAAHGLLTEEECRELLGLPPKAKK